MGRETPLTPVLKKPLTGAVLSLIGAVLLTAARVALIPSMGTRFPFALIYFWGMLAAWWWGLAVGLLTMAAAMLGTILFVVDPPLQMSNSQDMRSILVIAVTMVVCAVLGAEGRRSRILEGQTRELPRRLAAEEVRRHSIFESSLDAIVSMNAQGVVIDWNPAAETIFGYSREEAIGRRVAELIIPPELREQHAGGLTRALATADLSGPVIGRRIELTALHRNGDRFPIELAISAAKPPDSEPFFTGHLRDISERKEAQRRLSESETLLRELTDSVPALIAFIDKGLVYRFVNQTYLDWFDLRREDIVGRNVNEVLGIQAVARLQPYFDRAIAGTPTHFEVPAPYRHGPARWIEGHYVPRRDNHGNVLGIYVMVLEISARKRTEAALAETRQRLEDAMLGAGIVAWEFEPLSRKVSWVGDPQLVYGHLTPEEMRTAEGTLPLIIPEDRKELERVIEASLDGGHGTTYSLEFRIRTHEGDLRWASARGKVTGDRSSGKPTIVGILSDITERKKFEERLQESETNFRNLADNMSQLAWMADERGSIFWYNRRWFEYTGTTLEEMQGWGWKSVHHPDYVERVVKGYRAAIDSGSKWEDTFPMRAADGQFRWFLTRALPIRDENGKVIRWFGTCTDITSQRENEEQVRRFADELTTHKERLEELIAERTLALEQSWEQLRRTERMASLGTFAAGLGHDLHNSLLPLRVHIEELSRTAAEMPRISENVHAIEAIVGYLGSLSRGMRLFSRDVTQETDRVETDLVEWKQDACRFFQSSVSREIRVTCEVEPGTPKVALAPHRLSQAVLNLVTNAGDAITSARRSSGNILIRAQPAADNFVAVSVSDNGTGMTEEVRQRCMEPYFTTKVRGQGGTGMGMSMVFGIVTNAGGSMEIQTRLGEGTTIELLIPMAARPRSEPASRSIAHVSLGNRRIAAYVGVVLEAIGLRSRPHAPETSDASDLWVTDTGSATPQQVHSFLENHPGSKAVVIGGGREFAEAGALIAPSEAPLSGLRSAIVTAAGGG